MWDATFLGMWPWVGDGPLKQGEFCAKMFHIFRKRKRLVLQLLPQYTQLILTVWKGIAAPHAKCRERRPLRSRRGRSEAPTLGLDGCKVLRIGVVRVTVNHNKRGDAGAEKGPQRPLFVSPPAPPPTKTAAEALGGREREGGRENRHTEGATSQGKEGGQSRPRIEGRAGPPQRTGIRKSALGKQQEGKGSSGRGSWAVEADGGRYVRREGVSRDRLGARRLWPPERGLGRGSGKLEAGQIVQGELEDGEGGLPVEPLPKGWGIARQREGAHRNGEETMGCGKRDRPGRGSAAGTRWNRGTGASQGSEAQWRATFPQTDGMSKQMISGQQRPRGRGEENKPGGIADGSPRGGQNNLTWADQMEADDLDTDSHAPDEEELLARQAAEEIEMGTFGLGMDVDEPIDTGCDGGGQDDTGLSGFEKVPIEELWNRRIEARAKDADPKQVRERIARDSRLAMMRVWAAEAEDSEIKDLLGPVPPTTSKHPQLPPPYLDSDFGALITISMGGIPREYFNRPALLARHLSEAGFQGVCEESVSFLGAVSEPPLRKDDPTGTCRADVSLVKTEEVVSLWDRSAIWICKHDSSLQLWMLPVDWMESGSALRVLSRGDKPAPGVPNQLSTLVAMYRLALGYSELETMLILTQQLQKQAATRSRLNPNVVMVVSEPTIWRPGKARLLAEGTDLGVTWRVVCTNPDCAAKVQRLCSGSASGYSIRFRVGQHWPPATSPLVVKVRTAHPPLTTKQMRQQIAYSPPECYKIEINIMGHPGYRRWEEVLQGIFGPQAATVLFQNMALDTYVREFMVQDQQGRMRSLKDTYEILEIKLKVLEERTVFKDGKELTKLKGSIGVITVTHKTPESARKFMHGVKEGFGGTTTWKGSQVGFLQIKEDNFTGSQRPSWLKVEADREPINKRLIEGSFRDTLLLAAGRGRTPTPSPAAAPPRDQTKLVQEAELANLRAQVETLTRAVQNLSPVDVQQPCKGLLRPMSGSRELALLDPKLYLEDQSQKGRRTDLQKQICEDIKTVVKRKLSQSPRCWLPAHQYGDRDALSMFWAEEIAPPAGEATDMRPWLPVSAATDISLVYSSLVDLLAEKAALITADNPSRGILLSANGASGK